MEALNYKIAPKTFRRFVDDSHVRFQERSHVNKFLEILNKQDPAIKCTVEFGDLKHSLNFLDIKSPAILLAKNANSKHIERTQSQTYLLNQTHVYSEKYIKEEIQFLVDMFVENEHKKTFLESLIKDYNSKKKSNDSPNYINSKKTPWVPKMDQKSGKNLKR